MSTSKPLFGVAQLSDTWPPVHDTLAVPPISVNVRLVVVARGGLKRLGDSRLGQRLQALVRDLERDCADRLVDDQGGQRGDLRLVAVALELDIDLDRSVFAPVSIWKPAAGTADVSEILLPVHEKVTVPPTRLKVRVEVAGVRAAVGGAGFSFSAGSGSGSLAAGAGAAFSGWGSGSVVAAAVGSFSDATCWMTTWCARDALAALTVLQPRRAWAAVPTMTIAGRSSRFMHTSLPRILFGAP